MSQDKIFQVSRLQTLYTNPDLTMLFCSKSTVADVRPLKLSY